MKQKLILLSIAFLFLAFAKAQKVVDSTINKSLTDQKTNAVSDINDKVTEKRKKILDDVFNFSLKKKKQADPTSSDKDTASFQAGPGKTLITITGTDYTSLSDFADALAANAQVKKVDSEFSNGSGTLKVCHSGTVRELLGDLLKRTNGKLDVVESKGAVVSLKTK